MDPYRQQQAAAARAAMLRLEADKLEKEGELNKARTDYAMYVGAMQPPLAPEPAALPVAAASAPSGDWSFGKILAVCLLGTFIFSVGVVWNERAHDLAREQEQVPRQADRQGSWGNSVPMRSSRDVPARSRMIVGGIGYEQ